jgi:serine/threonine-protein kinase
MSNETKAPYGFLGLLWRLALAGVIVLGLSGAGGYLAVVRLMERQESTAPDLLTLEVEEALQQASDKGFSVILEKREPTNLLESGRVLAQRPAPGTNVKVGSTVRLTIATRP